MITSIVFDLDGTLINSKRDIFAGINHVFQELGYPPQPSEVLLSLIGPPLQESIARLFNIQDPAVIQKAVNLYNTWYAQHAHHQRLFPGIESLLKTLHSQGHALFIATAKRQDLALLDIEELNIAHYFEDIQGASNDGHLVHKTPILGALLEKTSLIPGQSLMIGDRASDVLAGKYHGLKTIGVTYGYGTLSEMTESQADALCQDPSDLLNCIQGFINPTSSSPQ